MAITLNSAGAEGNVSAQTLELGAPASISDDDILVAVGYTSDDVDLTLNETGWTKVIQLQRTASGDFTVAWWWKKAASESGDYTLDISGGVNKQIKGQVLAFTGCDTSTPVDTTSTTDIAQENSTTVTPPDITTATNGAEVFSLCGANTAVVDDSKTQPSGYTKYIDNSSTNFGLYLASKNIATASTESPGDWSTFGATTDYAMITFALRPAGGGGGGVIINQLQGSNLGADLFNGTLQ